MPQQAATLQVTETLADRLVTNGDFTWCDGCNLMGFAEDFEQYDVGESRSYYVCDDECRDKLPRYTCDDCGEAFDAEQDCQAHTEELGHGEFLAIDWATYTPLDDPDME